MIQPLDVRSGRDATVDTTDDSWAAPVPSSVAAAFEVTDCDGQPIAGLVDRDFRLFEDDEPIDAAEASKVVLERRAQAFVTLVLDNSPSVRAADATDAVADAAKAYIEAAFECSDAVYIAIAQFSRRFELVINHTANRDRLLAAVEAYRSDESGSQTTNLYGSYIDALEFSQNAQNRFVDQQQGGLVTFGQVLLLTDGNDNAELRTLEEAHAAKSFTRDDIFVVGLGDLDEMVVEKLSTENATLAEATDELSEIFAEQVARLQRRQASVYMVGYCSPRLAGEHSVSISIGDGEAIRLLAFDATGWDQWNGRACSTTLFDTACSERACGGLWCGACGQPEDGSLCTATGECDCANFFSGAQCNECGDRYTGYLCDACAPAYTGPMCEACADGPDGTPCRDGEMAGVPSDTAGSPGEEGGRPAGMPGLAGGTANQQGGTVSQLVASRHHPVAYRHNPVAYRHNRWLTGTTRWLTGTTRWDGSTARRRTRRRRWHSRPVRRPTQSKHLRRLP